MRNLCLTMVLCLATGLVGFGRAAALEVGQPAPALKIADWIRGEPVKLADAKGKNVVVVEFWATWCGPCRQEMPHLNRLYDKYRASGFTLLGVNVDDDTYKAAELAAKLAVKFPVLFDTDKRVSRAYDLSAMPATVLIDRDGRVRYQHRGYRSGFEDTYEQQIRELLKE